MAARVRGPAAYGEPWQSIYAWFLILVGFGMLVLMSVRFRTFWRSRGDFRPERPGPGAAAMDVVRLALGRGLHLIALTFFAYSVYAFTEETMAVEPWTGSDDPNEPSAGCPWGNGRST